MDGVKKKLASITERTSGRLLRERFLTFDEAICPLDVLKVRATGADLALLIIEVICGYNVD